MGLTLFQVSPRDIDCSVPWLFWSKGPDKAFLDSVTAWGVLQPVVVCRQVDRYILVSGFKRVQACMELNKEVPIIVITVDNELDRARIYVSLNLDKIDSILDIIVWARFFKSRLTATEFTSFMSEEVDHSIKGLSLAGLQDWLDLPPDWDKLLSAGHIHFDLASYLNRLTVQDLQALFPFFEKLSWSRNKARNLLTWLFETGRAKERPVSDLVTDLGLFEILAQDLSPKDCQQRILDKVRAWRYPCLKKLEDEFFGLQKKIQPMKYWRLFPEQHFETNGLYLRSLVRDRSETYKALAELQEVVREERLKALWDWQEKRLG